jgi:YfiH family protein
LDLGWGLDLTPGRAQCRFSLRTDGDLGVDATIDELSARRAGLVARPWIGLTQVHGSEVAVVHDPDGPKPDADALVTDAPAIVLSVNVADCAPIALFSPQRVVGAVHAGWRGVEAGVVGAAVDAMHSLGAREVVAWLGPCIHPECYEFGSDELDRIGSSIGPATRSRTRGGSDALDLPMAVARQLGRAGVRLAAAADLCTACDAARFYSFRARGDRGRHALAVWMDDGEP